MWLNYKKNPSKMTSLPDLEQKSISKRSLTVLGILKEIVIVLSTASTVIFLIVKYYIKEAAPNN